jgi:hypothetical protein
MTMGLALTVEEQTHHTVTQVAQVVVVIIITHLVLLEVVVIIITHQVALTIQATMGTHMLKLMVVLLSMVIETTKRSLLVSKQLAQVVVEHTLTLFRLIAHPQLITTQHM